MKIICYAGLILGLVVNSALAGKVADELNGKIEQRQGSDLLPAAANSLRGKSIIAFYYGASWCLNCQKFNSKLTEFYNKAIEKHPNFQLVFVNRDKSDDSLKDYVFEEKMDWLILPRRNCPSVPLVRQFATGHVPNLIILDADGNQLAGTTPDGWNQSPSQTLKKLKQLLDPSDPE